MEYKILNPGYEARIHDRFNTTGTMRTLDARLIRVEAGRAELALPFSQGVSQNNGFFHGGITGTLLDTACGYAALTVMPEDAEVLTVEYKTNFLAPAAGELLLARATVLRVGRRLIICEADGFISIGGSEKHVARMSATMMAVPLTHLERGEAAP